MGYTAENRAFATRTWLQAQAAELRERVRMARSGLEQASANGKDEIFRNIEIVSLTELNEIELALERLDLGLFGICEQCGGSIQEERLADSPFATRCIACEPRLES